MPDLVSRLLEAIAETERIARGAQHPAAPKAGEHWHWVHGQRHCPDYLRPADMSEGEYVVMDAECHGEVNLASGEKYSHDMPHFVVHSDEPQAIGPARHIAHNDPSSVLRRCAAHREIVELYRSSTQMSYDSDAPHIMLEVVEVLARAYGLEVTE